MINDSPQVVDVGEITHLNIANLPIKFKPDKGSRRPSWEYKVEVKILNPTLKKRYFFL